MAIFWHKKNREVVAIKCIVAGLHGDEALPKCML